MYRGKDREETYLFKELQPFGGQLEEGNRWLKIKALIPWGEMERTYAGYFSHRGRPGLDGRLVIGLFLLKHMSAKSDREVIWELQENVYWQSFCSLKGFVTSKQLNSSSLTKIRKRLGAKFAKELEEKTYRVLIEKKIIKAKGVLVDATVVPEKIKYPNDISLLNDVRKWLVEKIDVIKTTTKEKVRTYKRVAKKLYLNFAKKKKKTKKEIERTKRQMLQFVRRNLRQLKERVGHLDLADQLSVEELMKVAQEIYDQQKYMYKNKVRSVEKRIVSWWRNYVRPIKRGKGGRKGVEFGPKVCLSYVDGFSFLDEFNHDNYSEANLEILEKQIDNYEAKFKKKPPSVTGDLAYGTRANRKLLKEKEIRSAFKSLGRKTKETKKQEQYIKRKHRERNRIEGDIGNIKEHYGWNAIKYHHREGSEQWVRFCLLAKNLRLVAVRVS